MKKDEEEEVRMAEQKVMDGNTAAAYIAYAFSEVAGIYPITPSLSMGEKVDLWQTQGRPNIFGNPISITEMQSEAGVAGFVHGSLKSGALTTTFTCSQGLLLMLPNMYKIAGELLPTVFHVAARSLTTSALSIFGDHSDVMAVRQSGFVLLAESSVQEVMDLSAVAHLASLEASLPFLNFFDGFRTSHECQKISVLDQDDLKKMLNQEALAVFRSRSMSPNHPKASGSNQGPDLYFQQRETVNRHYQILPYVVQKYMAKINQLRGTVYDLVNYYGDPEAKEIIVAMGSVASTIEQTVDFLNQKGRKVGFLNIHLYRPFPIDCFLAAIPKTVEKMAVLDRTKEAGAQAEPLFMDVQSALYNSHRRPVIIGGRYGIGSKDTRPDHILSVFEELLSDNPKSPFTVGIEDDVTHLSLTNSQPLDLTPKSTYQALFWGLGGDGTVSASHMTASLIGENSTHTLQLYCHYDSRKQNGLTIANLRIGQEALKSAYLIQKTDFVSVSNQAYLRQYDVLKGLKEGGVFLLNTTWTRKQVLRSLPKEIKVYLAKHRIRFYIINAYDILNKVGLPRQLAICLQTAFFALTHHLPHDLAFKTLKESLKDSFSDRSQPLIDQNIQAIELSLKSIEEIEVPDKWKLLEISQQVSHKESSATYQEAIQRPIQRLEGNALSVGELINQGMVAGDIPLGGSVYEKRGLAREVPVWDKSHCVQCHRCSFVCPHAAIRPILIDDEELALAPEGYQVMDFKGKDGSYYRIQVSVEDCTGCQLCVEACPAKGKALHMLEADKGQEAMLKQEAINWAFSMTLRAKENSEKPGTLAYTQFQKPLLEFSGACPGCGETPYVKLLTQLFGNRMLIANATGCSSIWGAMSGTSPYCTNNEGQGPAWSNSLLEDNAEFGYGMMMANQTRRKALLPLMSKAMNQASSELQFLLRDWMAHMNEGQGSRSRSRKLMTYLEEEAKESPLLQELYDKRDLFVKPSQWIIGGDGWAYDIGYGGIDHVLASGADVNILVLDNEVYSNTGGHRSKGTPASAIAKFSSSGKNSAKKDLGRMAMTYENVYVAQVASGANLVQVIKAFEEAESYPGPSLIIAYVPCITHGLAGGMAKSLEEAKEAVACGYWSLYRYNPLLRQEGKCPMILDYKRPKFNHMIDFMLKQQRFALLQENNPQEAHKLFQKTVNDAKNRYQFYANLTKERDNITLKEKTLFTTNYSTLTTGVDDL